MDTGASASHSRSGRPTEDHMPHTGGLARLQFALVLTSASAAFSQSIMVTPADPSVEVGQTAQYSAAVTGLSGKGVTWSVAGVPGGNSTVGTIGAKGLFRAPQKPPAQNPVQIR